MSIHDVVIVGAGPCGLAVAARLREVTPAALFTDEEHRRYEWIRRHGDKMGLKHVRSGHVRRRGSRGDGETPGYDMVVLDAHHDGWMGRWERLFGAYEIVHLRSHMLWHVDPQDRDSLLAKAVLDGREDELTELKGCVGREMSKHQHKQRRYIGAKQDSRVGINQRDRNDYFNPSRELFADHCCSVARRYGLDGLVRQETLQDIDYGVVHGVSADDAEKLFTVTTDGTTRYARAVVLAVGPANEPEIPRLPGIQGVGQPPQACHSMHIDRIPDAVVRQRIADPRRSTNVLVVGGGLTSAQIADAAVRSGADRVWLVMRGPLRVKHFDVDLAWMGKFRNQEQARFWSADSDAERLEAIRRARGGGSITPTFYRRLKAHVKSGRVVIREHTELTDGVFAQENEGEDGMWTVTTNPPIDGLPQMDYIYFATGVATDFRSLPYLQTMLAKYPVEGDGSFPRLNHDLMWKDGVPLFLAGRLAALRIGPAAPNLGGAQLSAERIAWALEDVVGKARREEGGARGACALTDYIIGEGSKFSCLGEYE